MSAEDGGYYERLHLRLLADGFLAHEALAEVAEAYLDGRPEKANGHKMSRSGRDHLFWTTACVQAADAQDWRGEAMWARRWVVAHRRLQTWQWPQRLRSRSSAARSVSSFLAKQNRTTRWSKPSS